MTPDELIGFGWRAAEATLAAAESERTLVTHWFLTEEDDSVNADEHFGSNERTLRFLGVALPTLIDQLGASMAMVALPWDEDGVPHSLTIVAITADSATLVETRALTPAAVGPQPPFWRLEPGRLAPPPELAAVAAGLAL